jgi:hypothetical protein
VNSASRAVAAKKSSSSEDEESSITGMFPEGPPYSNTSERGQREVISNRDPGGHGDQDDADDGVLASLGEGLPQQRESVGVYFLSCPPLLRSREQERERNPKQDKEKECEMVPSMKQMRYL